METSRDHQQKLLTNKVSPERNDVTKPIEMTPIEDFENGNKIANEWKKESQKEKKRRRHIKIIVIVTVFIIILILVLTPVSVLLAKKGKSTETSPTKTTVKPVTLTTSTAAGSNGTSEKPTFLPTTGPTSCGSFYPKPSSSSHRWECSNGNNISSVCTLICLKNGYRSLIPTSSCLSNGLWSGLWSECIAVDPCELKLHNCSSFATCLNTSPGTFSCICNTGFAGNGFFCGNDTDADGIPDHTLDCTLKSCKQDNCLFIPNSGQEDLDADGKGNACDTDDDNDGILDINDNCPLFNNTGQKDRESDGIGDLCDNCPNVNNTDQIDTNHNGIGDACDADADSDGVLNREDNCLLVYNVDQKDRDSDGIGDACDNCLNIANTNQTDADDDFIGDLCQYSVDLDSDGIADNADNCKNVPNGEQTDTDKDGLGDVCDSDKDGDGISNIADNCPLISNPDQADKDKDGVGDVCQNDDDGDGVKNEEDDYPMNSEKNQTDFRISDQVVFDDKGTAQAPPQWFQFDQGRELLQTINGNPGALISKSYFGDLVFTGTLMVRSPPFGVKADDDYVGILFGFQSNRKFYVCSWKKNSQSYNVKNAGPYPRAYGRKGINLKKFHSSTGPGVAMRDALWETGNWINQSTLLWHDQSPDWQFNVSYRWRLQHNPDSGRIRIRWYQGKMMISDSGDLIDRTWRGGRVGVFVFSQENVYFSAMRTKNEKSKNFALELNGNDSYVNIGNQDDLLSGEKSFTMEFWTRIDGVRNTTCKPPNKIDFGTLDYPDTQFFTQDTDDERNWGFPNILVIDITKPTGPEYDHTSGNGTGRFAYFNGRWNGHGPYLGDRARLVSPWFPANESCSLEFFLHMWDGSAPTPRTNMGSLQVDVRSVDKMWSQLLWVKGNQSSTWHTKKVQLKTKAKGDGDIQVRFTAVRGHGSRSDIAIDDLQFGPGCGVNNNNKCEDDSQYLIGSDTGKGLFLLLKRGRVIAGFSPNHTVMTDATHFKFGEWNHLVLSFNATTKNMTVYINKKFAASKVLPSFEKVKGSQIFIGKQGQISMKGFLDEIRIWNKDMSIATLPSAPMSSDHLQAKYSLDEGEGAVATDSSIKKSHAFIYNAHWIQSFIPKNK